MNHQMWVKMVREYAALAQRKHKSYAEQVHALTAMRAKSIEEEVTDPAERSKSLLDMQALLNREYQPFDRDFGVQTYD